MANVARPQEQLAETIRIADWARVSVPVPAPKGWNSAALSNAYRLVGEIADATSSESAAWPAVKAALDAIESADCALEATA